MKVRWGFLLLIFFSTYANSQFDSSLIKSLDTISSSTAHIDALNRIARQYRSSNFEESAHYALKAYEYGKKEKYVKGQIDACYQLGATYLSHSKDVERTRSYFNESIELAKSEGLKALASRGYNGLSMTYAESSKKIELIKESIRYAEEANDLKRAGYAQITLGNLFYKNRDLHSAIYYYEKVDSIANAIEDNSLKLMANVNLSGIYAYSEINQFDKAISSSQIVFSLINKNQNPRDWANAASNRGFAYFKSGELDSARKYCEDATEIYRELDSKQNLCSVLSTLGAVESEQGNYFKAEGMLFESLSMAKEYELPDKLEGIYNAIRNNYKYQNEFEKYELYSDTLLNHLVKHFNQNLSKQLSNTRAELETNETEKELIATQLQLEKEKQRRNQILFGSVLSLLLLTLAYVLYRHRQRQKTRAAEQALVVEKQRAKDLEEIDKMKDQFFTNISHEIRTPLTLISDPLANFLRSEEGSIDDIRLAHDNSKKLLNLTNEILDLAKLEKSSKPLKNQRFQLSPFLKRLFNAFSSYAHTHEVNLKYIGNIDHNRYLTTDPAHLEKILNNLISNAIKFSPKAGVVKLNAVIIKDRLIIEVIDEGKGISHKDQDKIFDRFFQANQDSFQGGTGIGLALSYQLTRLIGGELMVRSEENMGSTFIFSMPVNEDLMAASHNSESHSEENKFVPIFINGQKPRILLIEDNLEMSNYLIRLFEKRFDVIKAMNGIEGLQKLQTETYDLVISDVMMPGLDGLQLREKMMALPLVKNTPYMFLSAKSMDDQVIEGLRLGVDDYMTKPFNSEELLARVSNLISNRSRYTESYLFVDPKHNFEKEDHRFLKQIEQEVLKNLNNADYKIQDLAKASMLSQKQLSRKLKDACGMTAIEFTLEVRLHKAKQLIERNVYENLSDIRMEVGIESASYFSKKFKEKFGVSPSELTKNH